MFRYVKEIFKNHIRLNTLRDKESFKGKKPKSECPNDN